jgi:hypothetical protein
MESNESTVNKDALFTGENQEAESLFLWDFMG